jgi:two-component system, cell cycle sensor histidine kinase and response regulator CckA
LKNLFRQYLDSLKDAVVVIQSEKLIYINKKGKYLFGVDDDIALIKLLAFFEEESREKILDVFNPSISKTDSNDFEIYFNTQLNKSLHGFCKVSKIFIDKQVAYILNLIIIPSSYKLKHKDDIKIKGEISNIKNIAGGIAHNFNNALASMSLAIETLKYFIDKTPKAIDLLDKILRLSLKMAKWTNQLLSYAQLGKYVTKELNINELIQNAVEEVNESLPEGIEIVQKLNKSILPIKGDPTQIKKAIIEIVQNGVEAITEKGRVLVLSQSLTNEVLQKNEKYRIRPCVKITVQDNGCGMDKEIMSRIFEPFFSTKFQGRGLGLPAAYGVVENHFGEIYVESTLGKGSKFDIYFPVPDELKTGEEAGENKRQTDAYVLIIDSDEDMQFIIKSILESYGYQIVQARNLVEALSLSKTIKKYDLIFFNSTSVSKDELLIFSYVQSNQPDSRTLVLMNYGDTETKSALSGLNITRIVHNPFDQNELVEILVETLS